MLNGSSRDIGDLRLAGTSEIWEIQNWVKPVDKQKIQGWAEPVVILVYYLLRSRQNQSEREV